ncbi:hypothetical protein LTR78_009664 [Recurvomyces mirabilis]|uniref:Uncharacterized protein n=1 Tax=Recurvomyces mirabilis TaxID=574656 RepID=A0AAE0TND6_9PEZI|nr:hypothetical protein LTR78_009664 [Recurvomyces mirabilis]KAK5150294.1 hypothetical protein LTS14_010271 [Recurvomyces mirabilis]
MAKPKWQPGEENIPKELRSHNGSGLQEVPDSGKRESVRERVIGDVELHSSAASAKRRKEEVDDLLKTKAHRGGQGWDAYTAPHVSTDGDESDFEAAISDKATSTPDEELPHFVTPFVIAQDTATETTDHTGPFHDEIKKVLKLLEDYHSVLLLVLSTLASGVYGPGCVLRDATIEIVPYNIEDKYCDVLDEIFEDQLRKPMLEAVLKQPCIALPKLKTASTLFATI